MAFSMPKETYTGAIKAITVGKGEGAVTVGGETAYPFHTFEGAMPHKPVIAMNVTDVKPTDWAPTLVAAIGEDVMGDPAAWAKAYVAKYKPDMIYLELTATDPNGADAPAADAVATVKKVLAAIDVPLVVWGCGNDKKDAEVLRAVMEGVQDKQLLVGPVVEGNYKQLGAGAIGYGHKVIASTPIDINLAKQLNILLGNLGVPADSILVDPTTGGLGYGLEYTYSVMERARMAALVQQDDKLQYPLLCNIGREVWKTKEAKASAAEMPELGDPAQRGVAMECLTATTLLLAGADVLVLRHPESVRLVREYLGRLL
jgi:acetyl-CoA decarbonylase/synthase complex subunit delta